MRIYLPATFAVLDAHPQPITARAAHAVTPAVRAALPREDEEAWEFVAQLAAADESLDQVTADDVPLRLVVVADVAAGSARPVEGAVEPSAVRLDADVEWRDVVCVLVDEPEAADDVRAVLAGDATAGVRLAERDLLWYDVSEIDAVPRAR